jgi:hypothetical protein
MSELHEFIKMKTAQNRPITESTMKKYAGFYKTLSNHLGNIKIGDVPEEEIITIIDNLDISPAGKLNYQNVVTMIRTQQKQSTEKLVKFKNELTNMKDANTKHKVVQKLITLPTYKQVRDYIDELYTEGDYSKYLANELIFRFGLRNTDVNLIIVNRVQYKEEKKNNLEEYNNQNWLIMSKKSCVLVINRYKTVKKYGTKTIRITNKNIVDAGNKLGSGWLVQNTKNQHVPDDNVHNYLNLMNYNGIRLRQSDYFKIHIQYLQSQPNSLHKINELGKTRGCQDLQTLDKHYNLENGKEEDEENQEL